MQVKLEIREKPRKMHYYSALSSLKTYPETHDLPVKSAIYAGCETVCKAVKRSLRVQFGCKLHPGVESGYSYALFLRKPG